MKKKANKIRKWWNEHGEDYIMPPIIIIFFPVFATVAMLYLVFTWGKR